MPYNHEREIRGRSEQPMTTQTTSPAEGQGQVISPDFSDDGRRQRSERSRKAIADALIRLVREGETMPSAERVSAEANVGLRTVFRHFDDMDSLYRAVSEQIEAEIGPIVNQPFCSEHWRGRLSEMIERRAQVFEWVMPFKEQVDARLLQSECLREAHRCKVQIEAEKLRAILPADVACGEIWHALFAALSIDMWRRLRKDQHLTVDEAKAIMERMASGILAAT